MSAWEVNDAVVKQNEGDGCGGCNTREIKQVNSKPCCKIPLLCTLRADYYSYLMSLTHLMLLDRAYAGNQRMEVF